MANRVIISGVRRAGELVEFGELYQMVGRAGRGYESGDCHADIVVADEDLDYVTEGFEVRAKTVVRSVLPEIENASFHLLPEICFGKVRDKETAQRWMSRSFGAFTGVETDIDGVFDYLEENEAITRSGKFVSGTTLGETASQFYFHTADVKAWKDNFSRVFNDGLENEDTAIAWALGNVVISRKTGDLGSNRWVFEEFRNAAPADIEPRDGAFVNTVLWWNVFGGPSVGKMRVAAMELKDDFGRIHRVLTSLDMKMCKWDMGDFFDTLLSRSRRAIPMEIADLCLISGMTKGKAIALYNMGITNREELESAKTRYDLTDILGDSP